MEAITVIFTQGSKYYFSYPLNAQFQIFQFRKYLNLSNIFLSSQFLWCFGGLTQIGVIPYYSFGTIHIKYNLEGK